MSQVSEFIDVKNVLVILSDIWTISLTIAGTLVSIMTLLYSLALGKKDELLLIMGMINNGNKGPQIIAKKKALIKNIERLKNLTTKCFVLLIISILILVASWIGWRLLQEANELYAKIDFVIVIVLCLIGGCIFIRVFVELFRQYKKNLTL